MRGTTAAARGWGNHEPVERLLDRAHDHDIHPYAGGQQQAEQHTNAAVAMKKTAIIGAAFLLPGISAYGQCTMTTLIQANNGCNGGSVGVNTTGGTGPYVISVDRFTNGWQPAGLGAQNDVDGDYSWSIPVLDPAWITSVQARVTVTDISGCIATDSSEHWLRLHPDPVGGLAAIPDCVTGLSTLRVQVAGAGDEHPATYNISGMVGSFSEDWTYLADPQHEDSWEYNVQVSGGSLFLSTSEYIVDGNRGCETSNSISFSNVSPGDCGVNLRVKASLDGVQPTGAIMSDGLRSLGLVPLLQPYSGLGYTFVGSPTNVSITPAQIAVTGSNAIVDWMVAELRTSPGTVVWSKPVLLQRDGDLVDADGDTYLNFPVAPGSYYIALRHRNHLGIMTSTPRNLGLLPGIAPLNFRSATVATYGTDARVLKGTLWCLWAGDATGNGQLNYTGPGNDRDPILTVVGSTTPNNTVTNVYDRRDTNLDGVIKYTGTGNDRDIILNNVGSTTPNNARVQQLP